MSQIPSQGGARTGGFRVTPKMLVFIVLLVLAIVFAVQNSDHVDVQVYFWDVRLRLVWALLIVGVIGAILGWILPRIRSGARRR
jgi:uncharacterized integral membrane protein